jgi:alpha-ketoglutarate-dependent taurine dioxygenase
VLAGALFQPFKLDGRGEQKPGAPPYSELAPCAFSSQESALRTFYHSEYMRSVVRHEGVELTAAQARLLDLYDARGADPDVQLDMWLEPGDMQFLSNHSIAHARTAYEDDPAAPRHLLRLWLSLA